MIILRPIRIKDLDSLLDLASMTRFGLTSLPPDKEILKRRVQESLQGFSKMVEKPGGETYLFVLEDLDKKKVVGISGIVSKVGGFEPFYAYGIKTVVHESETLKIRKEIRVLKLVREHNGPCEIGSLFLHPDYRGKNSCGRLLSLGRFLFMADKQEFFDPVVIAEMRGVIDDNGRSPFWECVGRHFFDMDFPKADYLSMRDKRFIAELMPAYPIYLTLLPKKAQDVIDKVHDHTQPALNLLRSEGFEFSGMVDIFEAGPIVTCPLEKIRTVRESEIMPVNKIVTQRIDSDLFLISNTKSEFRACTAPLAIVPGLGIEVTRETASALKIKKGDAVRIASLRPGGLAPLAKRSTA